MAISSINIQPSSGNAIIHNERIFDVAYALKNDDVNEYHRIASISETRKAIYEDYKLHHGRKLNTKATPIREAVVNLNENHKMEDLINLSQMLENDYQMKVLHIAIHRDEGHIDKDGKENINYHAHLVFHNYDFDKHITIKRDKEVMRKLQTDVAKTLGMERGLENSQAVRLDHRQYKRAMQEVEVKTKELKKENEVLKEENQELKKYDFKEMQKKITQLEELNSSQKKELHQLNSQVKNNKAEYDELLKKIDTLTVENKDLKSLTSTLAAESVSNFEEAEKQKEKVKALETQNKSLQEEIKQKPIQSIEVNQIEVLNYSKAESDLSQDFYSMIEKREFKTGLMSKEDFTVVKKIEVGKPNILEVMKAHFKKMYQSMSEKIKSLTFDNSKLRSENTDLKRENLKLTTEINKYKTLSLTGEKKETALDKIVSNYDKMKAKELDLKEILQGSKKDLEQEKPKAKEEIKPKQHRGYELG